MVVLGTLKLETGLHEPVIDDALLEATLVHLRLMNEFLVGSRHKHAVNANHWVPNRSASFLTPEVLVLIDAQVRHLSALRAATPSWEVPRYTYECCKALDGFLKAVARRDAARVAAFNRARLYVDMGLSEFQPRAV